MTLLFCISDVDNVVGTATLIPLLQIFQDSLGLSGATFCLVLNLVSLFLAMCGILCAGSRIVWSMARDKGLPFSGVCVSPPLPFWRLGNADTPWFFSFRLGRVDPTFFVPIWALALNCFVPAILIFIYLGSTTIFFAFFQITTIGSSTRSLPSLLQTADPLHSKRLLGILWNPYLPSPHIWQEIAPSSSVEDARHGGDRLQRRLGGVYRFHFSHVPRTSFFCQIFVNVFNLTSLVTPGAQLLPHHSW